MKQTEITLRALTPSDRPRLAQLANNKKIWDNVRNRFPYPYTEEHAMEFINFQIGTDKERVFVIEHQGEFCGLVGLILQEDVYRKSAEIGYWVGEPYWGLGIATRAVQMMVEHGFIEIGLARIFAGVYEYNLASMRVLEKNGFEKEGIARKAAFKNGKFWDEHRFALLNKSIVQGSFGD